MTQSLTYYVDETGFTGEDLMQSEQPIFVQASNNYTDEEAIYLIRDTFGNDFDRELKHTKLVRKQQSQDRIVSLVKILVSQPE
jgi:hypothetical protein